MASLMGEFRNFRVCLCLEIGSKPEEAILYCKKAISVCKSRVQRLMNELNNLSGPAETPNASDSSQTVQLSSAASQTGDPVAGKEAEIEILTGLCGELEKKLEDLQQLVSNPKSVLPDILVMVSTKARATDKNAVSVAMSSSQMGTARTDGNMDSSTVSTAHTAGTSGVTPLGKVGRGVKRVSMSSASDSRPMKKPSIDQSSKTMMGVPHERFCMKVSAK